MRQVPKLAIIGSGRIARHFSHYLNLMGISHLKWSRFIDPSFANLSEIVAASKRILILISDSAIEDFILHNQAILADKILIHFSGQLVTPLAYGVHPLMTFADELYSLEDYQNIPFVLDKGAPNLTELLPGLENPYYFIDSNKRAFYHSLCVMSGNFSCILWQKIFNELQNSLNLPREVAYPYLKQIFHNIQTNHKNILTGPLVRGDQKTITANLNALENDPFKKIYQAFVEVFTKKGVCE